MEEGRRVGEDQAQEGMCSGEYLFFLNLYCKRHKTLYKHKLKIE